MQKKINCEEDRHIQLELILFIIAYIKDYNNFKETRRKPWGKCVITQQKKSKFFERGENY